MTDITTMQKLHPFCDPVHQPNLGRLFPRLGPQEAQKVFVEHVWRNKKLRSIVARSP